MQGGGAQATVRNSVEQLRSSIERLVVAEGALSKILQGLGPRGDYASQRIGACRCDITTMTSILIDLHVATTVELIADTEWASARMHLFDKLRSGVEMTPEDQELLQEQSNQDIARSIEEQANFHTNPRPSRRLTVAYKSMLMFLRSIQDSIAAGIRVLSDQDPGAYTSMADLLKNPTGFMAEVLADQPDYERSFERQKSARDRVKLGIGFDVVGPQDDPGITFQNVTLDETGAHPRSDVRAGFRLNDLATEISQIASMIETVVRRATQ
jgi:hypothetical protein